MTLFIKAASIGGSIVLILALVVAVLKGVLTLLAFITGAIKILVFLAFMAVFIMVGLAVFRAWQDKRRSE